jgi:hypothetical protein
MHARELGSNNYKRQTMESVPSTSISTPAHNDEPTETTPTAEDDIDMSYIDANNTIPASPQADLQPLAGGEGNEGELDEVREERVGEQPTNKDKTYEGWRGKRDRRSREGSTRENSRRGGHAVGKRAEDPDETEEEVKNLQTRELVMSHCHTN